MKSLVENQKISLSNCIRKLKAKILKVILSVLVFFTVNAFSEYEYICPELFFTAEEIMGCRFLISNLEITRSAKSACFLNDLLASMDKVECLMSVGKLRISKATATFCMDPNKEYDANKRIECLEDPSSIPSPDED